MRFLTGEQLAEQVEVLKPRWSNLKYYLELFDEAGKLRPIFRAVMPKSYGCYHARRMCAPEERGCSAEEAAVLERLDAYLFEFREDANHFEQELPSLSPPDFAAPYVRTGSAHEPVNWRDWKVEIDRDERGRPITAPFAISFYGDWQTLRFWALLEGYTYTALMDPRQLDPSAVFRPDFDNNFSGKVRAWTVGDVRILGIVGQLEQGDWLEDLYRVKRIVSWGYRLYHSPEELRWVEGTNMELDPRWDQMLSKVRDAIATSCKPRDTPELLVQQTLRLIELWEHASNGHAVALADAVKQDLYAATHWAELQYNLQFDEFDAKVGRQFQRSPSLAHVLRPTWRHARDVAARYIESSVNRFNSALPVLNLLPDDVSKFITFLDHSGLSAWFVELAELVEQAESDFATQRRFLQLRSLAILFQPIVTALAIAHGNASDQTKVESHDVKTALKAFFADRSDWRRRCWNEIANNWGNVQTLTAAALDARLVAIAALPDRSDFGLAVKNVLRLVAFRHFGAHRFPDDPAPIVRQRAALLDAVVLCPLLYWKVATCLPK